MKKQFLMYGTLAAVMVLTPAVALAQDLSGVENLIDSVQDIVNTLIPIMFALIVIAFFYGLARYVFNADNEDARDQGKRIMVGGVIALTVAALIWGIVSWIGNILGIEEDSNQTVPTISVR
ncbi:MAG: hypothetical protein WDZ82_02730 [Candidatus Paceibacterota bacterium]